jgi:polyhydroxyalkanoate synthase
VRARSGAAKVHLLGYCMGGTFALLAAAADCIDPAGLVLMATPVRMRAGGLLATWATAPGFDAEALARTYGNVPPHLLQPAFKLLDPVGLATKLVHLDARLDDDAFVRFFLAMETWLEDSVSFPGRAFVDWMALYRTDALAEGTLRFAGRRLDLARIRRPMMNLVAEADYITPPASSLALTGCEEVRLAGGHIGLATGGEAHRRMWPQVIAWVKSNAASLRTRTRQKKQPHKSRRKPA